MRSLKESSSSFHSLRMDRHRANDNHLKTPRRTVSRRASYNGCCDPATYAPNQAALSDKREFPSFSRRREIRRQNSQTSQLSEDSFAGAAERSYGAQSFLNDDSERSLLSNESGIPAIQLVPTRDRWNKRLERSEGDTRAPRRDSFRALNDLPLEETRAPGNAKSGSRTFGRQT